MLHFPMLQTQLLFDFVNVYICYCHDLYRKFVAGAETQLKWENEDAKCRKRWGTCQANNALCQGGNYVSGLCGGPAARQCCAPCKTSVELLVCITVPNGRLSWSANNVSNTAV